MIIQNFLFRCCLSLSILLLSFQSCYALDQIKNPHKCSPSACGVIRNISFPFRLKHDPKHCGYSDYELDCDNNATILLLNSHKYVVKAINYNNFTIRLVHASIDNSPNVCSFPTFSAYAHNFTDHYYPYNIWMKGYYRYQDYDEAALPINLMSCQHPLSNSSLFTELSTSCASDFSRTTYIKVGHMNASDVQYTCTLDLIVMTSWNFKDFKNVSLSEIHHSLLYGFELSWFSYPCIKCQSNCNLNADLTFTCGDVLDTLFFAVEVLATLLFVFIVLMFIGVNIPGQIIVGFTCFILITYDFAGWEWHRDTCKAIFTLECVPRKLENIFTGAWYAMLLIGGSLVAFRFFILLPFFIGVIIYKFRTRHLSVFTAIEDFLRSDNTMMPIRYSYSEIKKMTGGFREKLGQGGYGCVYKGKFRSGHLVAVKLLKNSKAEGQDFMNEIATIGRIHHVNVVTLVGYCAERSKRALAYDFMPNGSLEKYIFNRDNIIKSLDWKTKYEIALGVARGIEYLHRGCDVQILHFDIKPHNILLDEKFVPKVSDFGLAKLCNTDKNTVTLTAARGTIGYVAPELVNRGFGGISHKADVYSFGMVLIEMVDLKRDLRGENENSSQYFPDWIYSCFDDIEFGEIGEDDGSREIGKKMTIVALWCIQMKPDDRPSMNEVVQMLEGRVEELRLPNRSSQTGQVSIDDEDQTWTTNSADSTSLLPHSHVAYTSVDIIVQH